MDNNQSYKTAYVAAYARLIEQYQSKEMRLFNDSLVKYFFSSYISFLMRFSVLRKVLIFMYNTTAVGLWGLQVCRTKYIDDILKKALDDGIKQIVILGTGFDTRPYRISGISEIKVFEVDLPIILDKKQAIIKKCVGLVPNNVIFIPMDFNIQKLDEVLEAKNLELSEPILFIWEGVTQYITEEAIANTLKFISKASSGSKLVFTYILKSVIDGTSNMIGAEGLLNLFEAGEQPWRFGLNPLEVSDFLSLYNLKLIEDIGTSFYKENYLNPIGRKLDISEIERIA
ncbi:MAG: methyltransferase, partial [Clostridiaceae bacterium]|nr:methyltransferase [Clostridiaceae bacterium]